MPYIVVEQVLIEYPPTNSKPPRTYRDFPLSKWNMNTTVSADSGYIIQAVLILDDDQHTRYINGHNQTTQPQVIIPPSPHNPHAEFNNGALRTGERRWLS